MSETYLPGEAPRGDQGLDALDPGRSSDADIQAILDQIGQRQKAQAERARGLTAGDLAFALMRQVPYEHWNTPLSKLGHFARGSSVKEIKSNPRLRDYTAAQAILQLFEMDDAARRRAGSAEE